MKRQPTPVFLPEEFHRQRSPVGYSPWDHRELDMTELLALTSLHFTSPSITGFSGDSTIKNLLANAGDMCLIPGSARSPARRNGNPFQYSCLGNPMERGAVVWGGGASVHGIAELNRI